MAGERKDYFPGPGEDPDYSPETDHFEYGAEEQLKGAIEFAHEAGLDDEAIIGAYGEEARPLLLKLTKA